jgi:hypothetical protein
MGLGRRSGRDFSPGWLSRVLDGTRGNFLLWRVQLVDPQAVVRADAPRTSSFRFFSFSPISLYVQWCAANIDDFHEKVSFARCLYI